MNNYNGRALLLTHLETGDVHRFKNIKELLEHFGYCSKFGRSLDFAMSKPRIRKVYSFWCYEEDLLGFADDD